jgi:potassium channel subfamily K member 18
MRGLNVMYDFMRRPSMAFDPRVMAIQQMDAASPALSVPPPNESPMTPLPENLENYEIDDEFNLPISVAIIMLLTYMFFGASIHCMWEEWSFFDAFYFVFISISTIGESTESPPGKSIFQLPSNHSIFPLQQVLAI